MIDIEITAPAGADIVSALSESRRLFGLQAADRYELLLRTAFTDLREDPKRVGVRPISGMATPLWMYHLRSVRQGRPKIVTTPRHLIVFRAQGTMLTVVRVLHERMSFTKQLS